VRQVSDQELLAVVEREAAWVAHDDKRIDAMIADGSPIAVTDPVVRNRHVDDMMAAFDELRARGLEDRIDDLVARAPDHDAAAVLAGVLDFVRTPRRPPVPGSTAWEPEYEQWCAFYGLDPELGRDQTRFGFWPDEDVYDPVRDPVIDHTGNAVTAQEGWNWPERDGRPAVVAVQLWLGQLPLPQVDPLTGALLPAPTARRPGEQPLAASTSSLVVLVHGTDDGRVEDVVVELTTAGPVHTHPVLDATTVFLGRGYDGPSLPPPDAVDEPARSAIIAARSPDLDAGHRDLAELCLVGGFPMRGPLLEDGPMVCDVPVAWFLPAADPDDRLTVWLATDSPLIPGQACAHRWQVTAAGP
jgi:hypothetical protein